VRGEGKMKILVLESSGNRSGSSNMLAGEFIRGARENGHEITEYDVCRADIRPCLGCGSCGTDGPCVHKDDYEKELKAMIKAADMLVFVMPVYYANLPAQLKMVVDRFYSFNGELTRMHKKSALIGAAFNGNEDIYVAVKGFYGWMCSYLEFEDQGTVLGCGCGTPEMTGKSRYMKEAFDLGKRV